VVAPRIVPIRRALTNTPLARQHEHNLARRAGRTQGHPIPWSAFRRSDYPAPALALAHQAQKMLATGEYGAIDVFARLASALSLNGAPFDLVASAARIPSDEIRHADYAIRLASLFKGEDAIIDIDRNNFEKRWERPIDLGELDLLMIEVPAIGETLAGALLTACQRRAVDATVKAVFTSIVSDEVHHARLGWYYLAWRAPQWSRAEQQRAANRAGEIVADCERRFWFGRDAVRGSQRAAKALGVLDSISQREVIRRVMEDEIVPALDAFGLGASHAWRARRRGPPPVAGDTNDIGVRRTPSAARGS
jgi:hypothetical protein